MSDLLTDADIALIERKHEQDQAMIDRPNGIDAWRLDMSAHDDIGALLRDRAQLCRRIAELEAKLAELGRLEPDGYDTAMRHDYVYLSTIKSVLGKRRRLT